MQQPVTSKPMYEEKNKYYVEINDDWWFLKDGKNFLFTSEMNGYQPDYTCIAWMEKQNTQVNQRQL